jgi:large subunit ribosomal protein L31
MQKNLHPAWNNNAIVTCACGASFTTGSVTDTIQVDICSACHPFFTGEMKFVDTQGRVEKFKQKMAKAQKSSTKSSKKATVQQQDPKSYKQLLQEQRSQVKKTA